MNVNKLAVWTQRGRSSDISVAIIKFCVLQSCGEADFKFFDEMVGLVGEFGLAQAGVV